MFSASNPHLSSRTTELDSLVLQLFQTWNCVTLSLSLSIFTDWDFGMELPGRRAKYLRWSEVSIFYSMDLFLYFEEVWLQRAHLAICPLWVEHWFENYSSKSPVWKEIAPSSLASFFEHKLQYPYFLFCCFQNINEDWQDAGTLWEDSG